METTADNAGRTLAPGDRVRVRPGVTGGARGGDTGTVHSIVPLAVNRPVRVALDDDPAEPLGFEDTELDLIDEAADQ
jgi:hypothetical protein